MQDGYRIGELAEKAGVTKRTIHYYIGKGLIPPPVGAGVASIYGEEHLLRLLLIKKLQEQFLPLDKIRERILNLGTEDVKKILDTEDQKTGKSSCTHQSRSDRNDFLFSLNEPKQCTEEHVLYDTTLAQKGLGKEYFRLDLGLGMELHFAGELYQKRPEIIRSIASYARKLINER